MIITSRWLAKRTMFEGQVEFYTPPHDGLDFFWVDALSMFRSFLIEDVAQELLQQTQRSEVKPATTSHNSSLVTIISHHFALALCRSADRDAGFEYFGIRASAYQKAATSILMSGAWEMSQEDMVQCYAKPFFGIPQEQNNDRPS